MTAGTIPPRTEMLNFRVSPEEKARLQAWAGTVPLGVAVRAVLWRAMGKKHDT